MVNGNIETEVLRLVQEISRDEADIRKLEKDVSESFSSMNKNKYLIQIESIKSSLDRKLELLRLLKS